jgi:DNA-binding XRE family transcriptional regulator
MDKMALETVGDAGLGEHERCARNSHHALIRAAPGGRRQLPGGIGNVGANDGEVAVVEFPNIRTTATADALGSVGVRVRPDAFDEIHAQLLTIVRCLVKALCLYFPGVASDKSQQAICSRVASILRQERLKRGLSMNTVAERAGLSQQMVSYVEREMRNPTLETLLRMAAAIDIDLAGVLGRAIKQARKVAPNRKT